MSAAQDALAANAEFQSSVGRAPKIVRTAHIGYPKMKPFDHVKIKSSGETGTIIDIRGESTKRYMVGNDKESEASDPDRWPIYDCLEHDLEITDQ